jgi:hypothetical protein
MMLFLDQEMNTMQFAKGTGTMPCILILPPPSAIKPDTDPKSQSEEKQSVVGDITTDSRVWHAGCISYFQTRENEIND